MKKTFSLLLALLLCLSLCACNNGTGNDTTNGEEDPDEHIHVWSDWETVSPATCTSEGLQQRTCSCEEIEISPLPALGHNEVIDEAVAATCTENGLTEGGALRNLRRDFCCSGNYPRKAQIYRQGMRELWAGAAC